MRSSNPSLAFVGELRAQDTSVSKDKVRDTIAVLVPHRVHQASIACDFSRREREQVHVALQPVVPAEARHAQPDRQRRDRPHQWPGPEWASAVASDEDPRRSLEDLRFIHGRALARDPRIRRRRSAHARASRGSLRPPAQPSSRQVNSRPYRRVAAPSRRSCPTSVAIAEAPRTRRPEDGGRPVSRGRRLARAEATCIADGPGR